MEKPTEIENVATSRDTCVLFAGVIDIRNFTDLTARVDDYTASPCDPKERLGLFNRYKGYVAETQGFAVSKIIEAIKTTPLDTKNQEPTWAMKPTGDGLLVALRVKDLPDGKANEGIDAPVMRDMDSNKCYQNIGNLLWALLEIVKSSSRSGGGQIANLTNMFLVDRGLTLALPDGSASGDSMFEIGCACAIGVGTFLPKDDQYFGVKPQETSDFNQFRQLDASGHAVNLAFRLCNETRRPLDGKAETSPPVLIQRRLMHILLGSSDFQENLGKRGWKAQGFDVPRPMRGVETRTCFGLSHTDGGAE